MKWIEAYLNELVALTNEMAPYLLLGFLFAGILHVYFPTKKVQKYFGGRSFRSVINSALLGIPLPLCSCGVIPTGVSFYKNGASKGSSVSFLISTPQTGVDSILVTYSLLGLPFAIIRPIIALITGIIGGSIVNQQKMKHKMEDVQKVDTREYAGNGNTIGQMLRYGFVEFLQDIAKWLVIGLLLAALISVMIPDGFFETYIKNDIYGMLLLLVAAIPLYVCATGSVPLAAVLLMKGISPGAALVFLMAGPATNIATMTVLGNVFGRKTLISYMFTIIGGSLLFGLAINQWLPEQWFTRNIMNIHGEGHGEHILPLWLKISSSIILTMLLINGFYRRVRDNLTVKRHQKEKNQQKSSIMPAKTIQVEGMTCNHCKMTVEKNLNKLEGIDNAEASPDQNRVVIEGDNLNLPLVESTINELGYSYKGEIS